MARRSQRLLPGKLNASRAETYLRPRRLDHPALAGLRNYAEELPWQICVVFQYWTFDKPLNAEAYVIAGFANDKPALIERPAGRGACWFQRRRSRIRSSRTDARLGTYSPKRRGRSWRSSISWSATSLKTATNVLIIWRAKRRGCNSRRSNRWRVTCSTCPTDKQGRDVATSGDDELAVSITDELGNYRLTAGGQSQRLDRGFSVNASGAISDLARFDPETLTAALPKDRVRLAENLEAVEEYVDVGRSGRELFPWMIGLVAAMGGGASAGESVLSEREGEASTAKDAKVRQGNAGRLEPPMNADKRRFKYGSHVSIYLIRHRVHPRFQNLNSRIPLANLGVLGGLVFIEMTGWSFDPVGGWWLVMAAVPVCRCWPSVRRGRSNRAVDGGRSCRCGC